VNIYESASNLQTEFRDLLASSPNFFDEYVRIVFSVSGFSHEVMSLVRTYNKEYGKKHPIILLSGINSLKGTELFDLLTKGAKEESSTQSKNKAPLINEVNLVVPQFSKVINVAYCY
jgi:hypothetical protein